MTRSQSKRLAVFVLFGIGVAGTLELMAGPGRYPAWYVSLQWLLLATVMFTTVLSLVRFLAIKMKACLALAMVSCAAAILEVFALRYFAGTHISWPGQGATWATLVQFVRCFAYLGVLASVMFETYQGLRQAERRAQNLSLAKDEVCDEIEERQWTEKMLQKSRLFAESIVEAIREPLLVLDAELVIIRTNPSFHQMFRLDAKATLGKALSEIGQGEWNEPGLLTALRKVLIEDLTLVNHEITKTFCKSGKKTLLLDARPIDKKDIQTRLILLTMYDITGQRAAQRELKSRAEALSHSNTELEQFAYIASHDLQEPLRMVASYCQLLQRRYSDRLDGDANEFIGYAVDGARRMQILINDLLHYSRLGRNGRPFEPTDCNEVLEQVMDNLTVAIEDCEAEIVRYPLPVVVADKTQLAQLFQNLIGNAIKFRKSHRPKIVIEADRENGNYVFAVRDDGIGIEEELLDRIFVIFQRLHNQKQYPGTGIGLAVCKKIVERHRGKIWVDSEVGKGTTFYFTLPEDEASDW